MGAIRQSCATGQASYAGSTSVERGERGMAGISRTGWLVAAPLLAVFAAVLFAMGRPPICPFGTVSLWHGHLQSDQNNPQLSDWYSFSHVNHGFIFFRLSRWVI